MNYIANSTVCTLSLALLSACGGGGDDSGAKPRTQDEIKSVASAGLVSTENMMTRAARVIGTLGSTLVTQSSVGGGSSGPATVSCATAAGGTGTRMSSLTKSATRVGLAPEDVLTVTYSNCATSSSGVVVNGTATVTAKSVIANATAANVDIQFRLDTTGLTLLNGTTANTVAGSIVARLKTVNGDTIQLSYVVPADKVFRSVDGSAGLTVIHGPNGTIAVDGVLSTGRETHRMEGV